MEQKIIRNHAAIVLAWLLTLSASIYLSHLQGSQKLDGDLAAELSVISDKLVYELGRYKNLPNVIAEDTSLQNYLMSGNFSPTSHVNASNLLYKHTISTGSDEIYLLDINGLAIATSNWQQTDSFLGNNYNFRPYYREAIQGQNASYFALGTQSGKRGFYFASAVLNSNKVIGVVVVKVSLSAFEKHQLIHSEFEYALSDYRGVLFFSSNENWNYKSVVDLPESVKQELIIQKQFGTGSIKPLAKIKNLEDAIKAGAIELPHNGVSTDFLFKAFTVDDEQWRIFVFAPKSLQQRYLLLALILGTLFFLLLYFFALYLKSIRDTKEMLIKSKIELEERVERRTLELRQTNNVLEQAIEKYKEAEATLKQTQGELIQAEKLAVLGEMSAGINHELNQPLTAMRSYAETGLKLLQNDRQGDAEGNLSLIIQLTSEMTDIIKKFKVFSRKSKFENRAVSARQMADEALKILHSQIKSRNVLVELTSETNLPLVAADSTLLEQVFVNIIFNAIQEVEEVENAKVSIHIYEVEDQVLVRVKDNGKGFIQEDIEQIFEPFYTTKKKGLGLGLTLSRRIIELFGGSIVATSNELKGACFKITLLPFRKSLAGQQL